MIEPMADVSAIAEPERFPKKHAGYRVDQRKATGEPSDEKVREIDNPVREPPGSQQLSRKYEERNCQKRKSIDALKRTR